MGCDKRFFTYQCKINVASCYFTADFYKCVANLGNQQVVLIFCASWKRCFGFLSFFDWFSTLEHDYLPALTLFNVDNAFYRFIDLIGTI